MAFLFGACPKDDAPQTEAVVPYAVQYPIDLALMDSFLSEYSLDFNANMDVTFEKLPVTGKVAIKDDPNLTVEHITEKIAGVDHKLYFIKLRQGINEKPSAIDSIFVNYKSYYLKNPTTATALKLNFLEGIENPTWFLLKDYIDPRNDLIRGWQEIFRLFNCGTSVEAGSGQTLYSDFGAGVMIIPSAFGYYNSNKGNLPAYSPLIFNFKLFKVNYVDTDRDGINSIDEDLNGDGFFTNDDTDGDGNQNFLDIDDDGDGAFTKDEIRKPTPLTAGQGTSAYYPFNLVLDNPLTPLINESEPKGIPDTSGDGTTTTRTRRHLDKNAKPPYTTY